MKRLLIAALLFFSALGLSARSAGQGDEKIPLPEYYGLYALIDGKLCGLDVPASKCTFRSVEVKTGRRANVGVVLKGGDLATTHPVQAIVLQKGIRFLVYQENPTALAAQIRLVPMLFIRNITVDTGWPENVRRSGAEEAWDTGNPTEMGGEMNKLNELAAPIQMLVKPLKTGMVLAVPSKDLTPGLYRFALGQDIMGNLGNQPGLYFWIGDAAEAERLKCVNATYKYAMVMSESKYAPCGQEPPTDDPFATGAEVMPSGGEATPSPTRGGAEEAAATPGGGDDVQGELVAIKGRWNEAYRLGDRVFFETNLAENFTHADTRKRRFMDRAKFLTKVTRHPDVKSMSCGEYKLSVEGETASLAGICTLHLESQSLKLKADARQAFTHRFVKKDGRWLFTATEENFLPNR